MLLFLRYQECDPVNIIRAILKIEQNTSRSVSFKYFRNVLQKFVRVIKE